MWFFAPFPLRLYRVCLLLIVKYTRERVADSSQHAAKCCGVVVRCAWLFFTGRFLRLAESQCTPPPPAVSEVLIEKTSNLFLSPQINRQQPFQKAIMYYIQATRKKPRASYKKQLCITYTLHATRYTQQHTTCDTQKTTSLFQKANHVLPLTLQPQTLQPQTSTLKKPRASHKKQTMYYN